MTFCYPNFSFFFLSIHRTNERTNERSIYSHVSVDDRVNVVVETIDYVSPSNLMRLPNRKCRPLNELRWNTLFTTTIHYTLYGLHPLENINRNRSVGGWTVSHYIFWKFYNCEHVQCAWMEHTHSVRFFTSKKHIKNIGHENHNQRKTKFGMEKISLAFIDDFSSVLSSYGRIFIDECVIFLSFSFN